MIKESRTKSEEICETVIPTRFQLYLYLLNGALSILSNFNRTLQDPKPTVYEAYAKIEQNTRVIIQPYVVDSFVQWSSLVSENNDLPVDNLVFPEEIYPDFVKLLTDWKNSHLYQLEM